MTPPKIDNVARPFTGADIDLVAAGEGFGLLDALDPNIENEGAGDGVGAGAGAGFAAGESSMGVDVILTIGAGISAKRSVDFDERPLDVNNEDVGAGCVVTFTAGSAGMCASPRVGSAFGCEAFANPDS